MALRKISAKSRRTYHKGNVRRDLLSATARVLKNESVEALSVRRLTRELDVTPANFYNHFPSLTDILLTLAAEGFDQIGADARRAMERAKSRKNGIVEGSLLFVNFAMENKQLFRIMFGQIPDAVLNEKFRSASNRSFGQLVRFMYGEEYYDPENLSATHKRAAAAYALFSLVYGLARNIIEEQFEFKTGSKAEIRNFVEEAIGTFVDGTAAKLFVE